MYHQFNAWLLYHAKITICHAPFSLILFISDGRTYALCYKNHLLYFMLDVHTHYIPEVNMSWNNASMRRSVTSDMWRHRKTLTYLFTTISRDVDSQGISTHQWQYRIKHTHKMFYRKYLWYVAQWCGISLYLRHIEGLRSNTDSSSVVTAMVPHGG